MYEGWGYQWLLVMMNVYFLQFQEAECLFITVAGEKWREDAVAMIMLVGFLGAAGWTECWTWSAFDLVQSLVRSLNLRCVIFLFLFSGTLTRTMLFQAFLLNIFTSIWPTSSNSAFPSFEAVFFHWPSLFTHQGEQFLVFHKATLAMHIKHILKTVWFAESLMTTPPIDINIPVCVWVCLFYRGGMSNKMKPNFKSLIFHPALLKFKSRCLCQMRVFLWRRP